MSPLEEGEFRAQSYIEVEAPSNFEKKISKAVVGEDPLEVGDGRCHDEGIPPLASVS